jgi:hypothetical protein
MIYKSISPKIDFLIVTFTLVTASRRADKSVTVARRTDKSVTASRRADKMGFLAAMLTKFRSARAKNPIATKEEFFNHMIALYFRGYSSSTGLQHEATKVFQGLPDDLRMAIAKAQVVVKRLPISDPGIPPPGKLYRIRAAWPEDPKTFNDLLTLDLDADSLTEYEWGLSFIETASKYSTRGLTLRHL